MDKEILTENDINILKKTFISGYNRDIHQIKSKFDFSDEYKELLNLEWDGNSRTIPEFDYKFNGIGVKFRLKAGLFLEDVGILPTGKTIQELTEEGWSKSFLVDSKNKINLTQKENSLSRISDISIFSLNDGGYAIRCKIDGEQQSAEKMTREDVSNLNANAEQKQQLAEKYFENSLKMTNEKNNPISR